MTTNNLAHLVRLTATFDRRVDIAKRHGLRTNEEICDFSRVIRT
jgi:hypothetical protein